MLESGLSGSVRGVPSNGHPLYVASCPANEHFAEQARRTVSLWRPLAKEPVR